MNLFSLSYQSIKNRRFATIATMLSIVLSLLLLFAVERTRRALEDGFTQTISGVDLIVGARTGSLQLVMYSVFNIGQATNNISYQTYKDIQSRSEIEWTIPYSLGDGHKGFRVVATNTDFFKLYQFRSQQHIEFESGKPFQDYFDVVLGSEVARKLQYVLNANVTLAHGSTTGDSFQEHADKPFKVVGILKPTGTALDRALYISLEGMEAIHIDWQTGAAPQASQAVKIEQITPLMVQPKTITSFFTRLRNRIDILRLQREINNNETEALLAVIPGVVLSELWQSLSQVEMVLKIISGMVMFVGIIGMLIALMTSLNERRREMAILRSLGANLIQIMALISIEVVMIVGSALVVASALKVTLEMLLGNYVQARFGLFLSAPSFGWIEILIMTITFVFAIFLSLVPALIAKRAALKDGLTIKN